MLDGELTHEYKDKHDNKIFPDSDDGHILLKWEPINAMRGEKFQKVQYSPLNLSTKE